MSGAHVLEVTVKPWLFALAALLAAPMQAQQPPLPPEMPFESAPDYFKYPAEMNLGEMASVAVNSKGHVFMLSRSNVTGPLFGAIATQVLEFDQNGKYVREIGKGVYGFGYAHSIRFDKDDNMWVVDKGTNMIMKFNPEGHVTMVLGRKEEAADEHRYPSLGGPERPVQIDNYFNQPTDIAWDKDGNSYISDGYVNSRVAKIDKNGDWVKSWGVRGTEPGQFNTPHNIGVDNSGNIYVADRANARIQVFDTDGAYLRTIKINVPAPPGTRFVLGNTPPTPPTTGPSAPGAPWTICITPGTTQYLYTNDSFPGRFYKISLPNGRIVAMFGKAGRQLGQFNWNHGIACPSENLLYAADLNNWRVQKLILHPDRMKPSPTDGQ
jgi:DNA-binding beta-propeller fold protein YncE